MLESNPPNSVSDCEIEISVLTVVGWVFKTCWPNSDQCEFQTRVWREPYRSQEGSSPGQ